MNGIQWTLAKDDMWCICAALALMLEELDENTVDNYGVQVAANRAAWQAHLRNIVSRICQTSVAKELVVNVGLNTEEASACGYALLVAANRLDHFTGVESVRGEPAAETLVLPFMANTTIVERVRRHFTRMFSDLGWLRTESLRLRLHAHRLLDHQS